MRRMLCLNFMPLWEAGETDLHHTFNIGGKTHALWLSRSSEGYRLELAGGWSGLVALVEKREGEARLIVDGRSEPIVYVHDGDLVHVHLGGQSYVVRYTDPLAALSGAADDAGHNVARAPTTHGMAQVSGRPAKCPPCQAKGRNAAGLPSRVTSCSAKGRREFIATKSPTQVVPISETSGPSLYSATLTRSLQPASHDNKRTRT